MIINLPGFLVIGATVVVKAVGGAVLLPVVIWRSDL